MNADIYLDRRSRNVALTKRLRARASTKAVAERSLQGTPAAVVLAMEIEDLSQAATGLDCLEEMWLEWREKGAFYSSLMRQIADALESGTLSPDAAAAKLRKAISLTHEQIAAYAKPSDAA